MAVLECVPNISEGIDRGRIAAVVAAAQRVAGVRILHVDPGPLTNRTVVTFAGPPEAVVEGAYRVIEKAAELIDMRRHKGVHPRIGATDVCPLVPLDGVTMEEAVAWSKTLGERVGRVLGIPVYLYEHSASAPGRRNLAEIRRGEYEHFAQKMQEQNWTPDYGPRSFNEKSGVTVIGVRELLVAFNVELEGGSGEMALQVAREIRRIRDEQRVTGVVAGPDLRGVKAIGWKLPGGAVQVSTNIVDVTLSGPNDVLLAVRVLAQERGIRVGKSEVIGCMPRSVIERAGAQFGVTQERDVLRLLGLDGAQCAGRCLETLLESAGLLS